MSLKGNWKDLLVTEAKKGNARRIARAPEVLSPLMTSFHKWAGKKRKLLFEDEKQYDTATGGEWNLDKNLFAKILQSPIRMDHSSRFKVPRDLMIQMKLEPTKEKDGRIAILKPQLENSAKLPSSYVGNSLKLFMGKKVNLGQLVPTFVHDSKTINISMNEIILDKSVFTEEYKHEMMNLLEKSLKDLLVLNENREKTVVENWDIILIYDKDNKNDIELIKIKGLQGEPLVVRLNLGLLENESLDDLINGRLKNHEVGVVLKLLKDERLISLVYKFLNFSG